MFSFHPKKGLENLFQKNWKPRTLEDGKEYIVDWELEKKMIQDFHHLFQEKVGVLQTPKKVGDCKSPDELKESER